jgi:hypothetical protein
MSTTQLGTAGGSAINVDLSRIEPSVSVRVQLSASYTRLHLPGMPAPPDMTGASAANLDFPKTLASGIIMCFHAAEAAALVAAGKASYV